MGDRYAKAVLTIIAVCLVWIALGGPSLLPVVGAQQGASEVVIVGWRDANGQVWPFPAYLGADPGPLHLQSARDSFERRVRIGAAMPVTDK
jgi:hypothetical protein